MQRSPETKKWTSNSIEQIRESCRAEKLQELHDNTEKELKAIMKNLNNNCLLVSLYDFVEGRPFKCHKVYITIIPGLKKLQNELRKF